MWDQVATCFIFNMEKMMEKIKVFNGNQAKNNGVVVIVLNWRCDGMKGKFLKHAITVSHTQHTEALTMFMNEEKETV